MVSRFLLIQTAFLGDVVLALPVAQYLRNQHPDAQIHFVVRKGNASILEHHPAVDHIHIWDKQKGKYRNLWQLVRSLRQYHFDEVINLHRFAASGWLTLLMRSTTKKGFDKNPLSRYFTTRYPHSLPALRQDLSAYKVVHEVQRNLQMVAGPLPPVLRPQLYPSEEDVAQVAGFTRHQPYVVLAPASVWYTKQWPKHKWRALLTHLPQQMPVYLVGSPADKKLAEALVDAHPLATNLCGQLTILQSAALMAKAFRVIVNDSGPLHFASGVNAPTTAIFCSTIPAFGFGPLADESRVVEIETPLPCRPCGLHGRRSCPMKHFQCATQIDVAQVFTAQEWEEVVAQYPDEAQQKEEIAMRLWNGAIMSWKAGHTMYTVLNPLHEQSWRKLDLNDEPALLLYTDQRMLNHYVQSLPDHFFDMVEWMHQKPLAVHLPFLKNLPEALQQYAHTYWQPLTPGTLYELCQRINRPLLVTAKSIKHPDIGFQQDSDFPAPARLRWTGQRWQTDHLPFAWPALEESLRQLPE